MTELRTLHDAFEELERRADAASVSAPRYDAAPRSHRPTARALAPVAAAAAVLLAVTGVAVWQNTGSRSPAGQPPGGSSAAPVSTSSAPPTAPSSSPPDSGAPTPSPRSSTPTADRYQPPSTAAELAARARSILAGIATITVTESSGGAAEPPSVADTGSAGGSPAMPTPAASVSVAPDAGSGAYIKGELTADGRTGGYDLNVFRASPGSTATCDDPDRAVCSVRTLGDGSSLAIGSEHDSTVSGGTTDQVEVVRPDGADILMHLSTEQDPKGESAVTASRVPLTTDQLIAFVTSDRW